MPHFAPKRVKRSARVSPANSRGIPSRRRRPSIGRIEASFLDRERAEDGEDGGEIMCRLPETLQTTADAANGTTSGREGDADGAVREQRRGRFRAAES